MLTNYLATQAGTSVNNMLSNPNGKAIIQDAAVVTAAENAVVQTIESTFNVTLSTSNFLSTPIVPPGAGKQSQTDADLDSLANAGAINPQTGGVTSAAATAVAVAATQAPPFVAPVTGTSGGS